MEQKQIYEEFHNNPVFNNLGKSTYKGGLVENVYGKKITTILDFGCGSGYAVRMMQKKYKCFGYEYSKTAFDKYLKESYFYNRIEDVICQKYDLIYSTEVMEHIPEELIDFYIDLFYRIANKYIFMTISLRPSSNNNAYHCTLKPRDWWEKKFREHGFIVDYDVVKHCQKKSNKTSKEIFSQWKKLGKKAIEFAENPPYELNGEEQPWYFAFKKRYK